MVCQFTSSGLKRSSESLYDTVLFRFMEWDIVSHDEERGGRWREIQLGPVLASGSVRRYGWSLSNTAPRRLAPGDDAPRDAVRGHTRIRRQSAVRRTHSTD